MTKKNSSKRASRAVVPEHQAPRDSAALAIVVGLLALVPVLFSRSTADVFEVPKVALLTTGALILGAWGLAAELVNLKHAGPGAWIRSTMTRSVGMVRSDPLTLAVLLFVASAAVSTIVSPNPAMSLHGAPHSTAGLVTACATATVYFAARTFPRGVTPFARISGAAVIAAAIATGYGLLQLAGLDPLHWAGVPTMGGASRIFSTLGHANLLAAYLVMTLPLLAWLASRHRGKVGRLAWMVLAVAMLTVLAATLSRGAWIALAVSGAAWFLLDLIARRSARSLPTESSASGTRRLTLAALGVLLLLIAGAFFLARSPVGSNLVARVREIGSLKAPTTLTRLQIWNAGLRMAARKPLLGVGTDAFAETFPPYRTAALEMLESGGSPPKAHNEAIEILVTQGALGALAAFLVLLFVARAAWRTLRHRDPELRSAAVAIGAALTGFLVQDLASFTVVALGTLAAALAGWLSAAATTSGADPGTRVPRGRVQTRPGWAIAIAFLLAAVAFVPLVLNPWRAEMAMRTALHSQAASTLRDQALMSGAALAPWDARFQNMLGWSLLGQAQALTGTGQRGEFLGRAHVEATRAIHIEPGNGDHEVLLGAVLAEQTLLKPPAATIPEVRAALAGAMARDPNNSAIMDQAASLWIRLGQDPEARAIAYRHATLLPNLAPPLATLGYIALQQRRWKDAADTLRLALAREWRGEASVTSKAQATTWNNLSVACIWLERFDEARAAAEKAHTLDPSLEAAEKNRSLAAEHLTETGSHPQ